MLNGKCDNNTILQCIDPGTFVHWLQQMCMNYINQNSVILQIMHMILLQRLKCMVWWSYDKHPTDSCNITFVVEYFLSMKPTHSSW